MVLKVYFLIGRDIYTAEDIRYKITTLLIQQ